MKLNEKIDVVKDMLANKKVAIGFSGGADSTLLAYLSSQVSKDTLAITIDNHLLPINFIENTKEIAKTYNIKHEIIDLDFYNEEEFLKNTSERCFNCRDLMYATIKKGYRSYTKRPERRFPTNRPRHNSRRPSVSASAGRSEEHTSELQSQ